MLEEGKSVDANMLLERLHDFMTIRECKANHPAHTTYAARTSRIHLLLS